MLGRISTVAITIFWLVMMGILFKGEVLPVIMAKRAASQATTYSRLDALLDGPRVSQMGIYLGKRRVGQTLSRVTKQGKQIRVESQTEIKLNLKFAPIGLPMSGADIGGLSLRIRFEAHVVERKLLRFSLTADGGPRTPPMAVVEGSQIGSCLMLKIRRQGGTQTKEIPFDPEQLFSTTLGPALALPELDIGKRWAIRMLQPPSYTMQTAWAEVVGTEKITLNGEEHETFVIKIRRGSDVDAGSVTVWASPEGEILKQKIFGFIFVREEPPPDALDRAHL